ncbi:MAG: thioredoxin-disulfide reductase [Solitalea-like symbiont of Tyrophagus putrescentiae]
MTTSKQPERIKCLIIGSGPAGYTAATYAARAMIKPVLYKGLTIGGQLMETTEVENFPGFQNGIQGPDLMINLEQQAAKFGTDIRIGQITNVKFSTSEEPHQITIDNKNDVLADTVIIATGASAKWLGLDSEKKYNGRGVSACAVCDGFFFKNKIVAVVGGGDTAAEEALYLSKLCERVFLLVRSSEMKASKTMQLRVEHTANIQILYDHETLEVIGNDKTVTGAKVLNLKTKEESTIAIEGFFVAIGRQPNTSVFTDLTLDKYGYISTKPKSTETNISGVFACGDVQDPTYKQAVVAAATGCMAALDAEKYLMEKNLT